MVTARLEAAGSGIRAAHSPSSREIRDTNTHLDRVAPLPIRIEQFHRALLWPLHHLHRPDLVLLARPTHQHAANPSRRRRSPSPFFSSSSPLEEPPMRRAAAEEGGGEAFIVPSRRSGSTGRRPLLVRRRRSRPGRCARGLCPASSTARVVGSRRLAAAVRGPSSSPDLEACYSLLPAPSPLRLWPVDAAGSGASGDGGADWDRGKP